MSRFISRGKEAIGREDSGGGGGGGFNGRGWCMKRRN